MRSFFYYCSWLEKSYRQAVIECDLEKLDLFGTDYLFDKMYFDEMKKREEKNYRTYITDSLKNITEVILKIGGVNDPDIPRFADMIESDKQPQKSTTAAEAIDLFRKNCEAFQQQKQKDGEENG